LVFSMWHFNLFKYGTFISSPGTQTELKVAVLNSNCTRLEKEILLLFIYASQTKIVQQRNEHHILLKMSRHFSANSMYLFSPDQQKCSIREVPRENLWT
jgi:hypothetical protein